MKFKFRLAIIICFFAFSIPYSYSQQLPVINPNLGENRSFSVADYNYWLDFIERDNIGLLRKNEYKRSEDLVFAKVGPNTITQGDSWYNLGSMYDVKATSELPKTSKFNYIARNIHDGDLFTAWSPDTKKETIGSKIFFYFEPLSPRVNKLIIYNGYIKNTKVWKENSRVKKMKLYVNDLPYAILNLEDKTNAQHFKIEPQQSLEKGVPLILTLEILEIYPGSKYKDVAISEINFDGLDGIIKAEP